MQVEMKTPAHDKTPAFRREGLTPLWEVVHNMVLREPKPAMPPYRWDYDALVRPAMLAAGDNVLGQDADRRVVLLTHPGLPHVGTTPTLIAGMQLINGGEFAEAHRHSQAALRVVVEGEGAFTSVDGERLSMERGDLILTPSWTWHDHEKRSEGPMIWLDGLDVPLVTRLGLTFSEEYAGSRFPPARPDGYSNALYGHGLSPMSEGREPAAPPHARQLHFPYRDARRGLSLMNETAAPDPVDGYALRYTNGEAGGHVMPTIGAGLRLLPRGFAGLSRRCTDANVFFVLEGHGATVAGDTRIEWNTNDVFVVPNWTWHAHQSAAGAVLFSFSDAPLQERIGLWREERKL